MTKYIEESWADGEPSYNIIENPRTTLSYVPLVISENLVAAYENIIEAYYNIQTELQNIYFGEK